jgi:DHA2 family multidrug resistance protein-like MFS transporter
MPSTMSLIRVMFRDPRQRTAAIGVWVSGFSVGSAIGPLVGGALLEFFWWGSVFLLAVPVMALLLTLGPLLLPEYRDPNPGRFDLPSAGLSLAGVLAVIFGVKLFAEDGPGWLPAIAVAAGLAIGYVFVRRQRALADPLIDLGLFRVRAFSASMATVTLGIFFGFGVIFFLAQYLQLVAGMSPLEAGLWTLPSAVTFIVGSNLAPVIVRRVRPGYLIAGGLAIAALGFALLTQVGLSSAPLILAAWLVMTIGFAPTFTLATDLVIGAVPPERAGAASAISETGSELGGALGIAILGSFGTAVYRSRVAGTLPDGLPPEAAEAARDTLGGALAVAGQLPEPLGAALLEAARQAFVQGLQLSAIIGGLGLIGTALLAARLLRQVPAASPEAQPAEASEAELEEALV